MRNGSLEHRDLICREFINGFSSYEARTLPWPELNAATAARLRTIPFWSVLIRAEQAAAERARRIAANEADHAMREALGLLAYEKTRTASLIECMMRRYGIKAQRPPAERGRYSEWGFILSGAAETYNAIFAAGLFRLAETSLFLPSGLTAIFEQVMSEEARHVLFFHNWAILRTRCAPLPWPPVVMARRCAALMLHTVRIFGVGARIAANRQPSGAPDDFVAWTLAHIGGEVSLGELIELGAKELAERMDHFDPRLPRPYLVPKLLRLASPLLKRTNEARETAASAPTPERPAEPRDRSQRMAGDRLAAEGVARSKDERDATNGGHADNKNGGYAHNQYEGFPAAAPQRRRSGWRTPRRPSHISIR
jgi:hypothetical protein